MMTPHTAPIAQVADGEWVPLQGGELEGRPSRVLCPACRAIAERRALLQADAAAAGVPTGPAPNRPLCFQCYRAGVQRDGAIAAAGRLDTASEARFQELLPFEPVNHTRLTMLRAERSTARVADRSGAGRFVDRRRQAQIQARHALERLGAGLRAHMASGRLTPGDAARMRSQAFLGVAHAAELQLPESWLPFVVGA